MLNGKSNENIHKKCNISQFNNECEKAKSFHRKISPHFMSIKAKLEVLFRDESEQVKLLIEDYFKLILEINPLFKELH